MRMTIPVPPSFIVLIRNILRYYSVPHVLKIAKEVRLIFDSCYPCGRSSYKQNDSSSADPGLLNLSRHLMRYVNDIAIPFGLKRDVLSKHCHIIISFLERFALNGYGGE